MALMKCSECAKEISSAAVSCPACGHPLKQSAYAGMSRDSRIGFTAVFGLLVGSVIGFLMRPSLPMVGQLPLGIVITGGAQLQGFDQMLLPAARQSFSFLLAGAIGGSVVGSILGRLLSPAVTADSSNRP